MSQSSPARSAATSSPQNSYGYPTSTYYSNSIHLKNWHFLVFVGRIPREDHYGFALKHSWHFKWCLISGFRRSVGQLSHRFPPQDQHNFAPTKINPSGPKVFHQLMDLENTRFDIIELVIVDKVFFGKLITECGSQFHLRDFDSLSPYSHDPGASYSTWPRECRPPYYCRWILGVCASYYLWLLFEFMVFWALSSSPPS